MADDELEYVDPKSAFMAEFEALRPDLMYSEGWSESERQTAAEILRPTKVKANMLQAIPMKCLGEDCFIADRCPLMKEGIAPVGSACPIEMSYVQQFFYDYIEELDVDVERMVEVSIVRDLVDQEIQHIRKTWALSEEHFIQENVVGIDDEGNVITQKQLHQAVDYEDKILKRKEKLRNALLATREAKAKAGKSTADNAQIVADVLEGVRRAQVEREESIKRELGMSEVDDYIIEDAQVVEDEEE